MTEDQFEQMVDNGYLDSEYSDYIMNCTDAMVGNGDMLISAIESGKYYEGFKEWMIGIDGESE